MNCPKCNAQNADDAAFCAECGASLREAAAPAAPVATPAYAPAAQPVAAFPVAAEPAAKLTGWKKIVTLVGSICGLVTVVLAFIFTFLYGVMYVEGTETMDIGIAAIFQTLMEIIESMSNGGDVNVGRLMTVLYQYVFTAYILVGFAIAMLVVLIKSIIRYVKEFRGEENKGVVKLTVGAYGLYALGATLIYSLYIMNGGEEAFGVTFFEGYLYSPATVAGLVLGAITLAAFLASRVAVQAKGLLKKSVMIPGILTLCTIVIVGILWGLAVGPILNAAAEGEFIGYNFLPLVSGVVGSNPSEEEIMQLGMLFSGLIMQIVVLSLAASLMIKNLRDLARKQTKSGLGISIALVVFSIGLLSVSASFLNSIGEGEFFSLAVPAVVMVMSLLALGLTIANKILRPKLAVKENIEQAQAPQA